MHDRAGYAELPEDIARSNKISLLRIEVKVRNNGGFTRGQVPSLRKEDQQGAAHWTRRPQAWLSMLQMRSMGVRRLHRLERLGDQYAHLLAVRRTDSAEEERVRLIDPSLSFINVLLSGPQQCGHPLPEAPPPPDRPPPNPPLLPPAKRARAQMKGLKAAPFVTITTIMKTAAMMAHSPHVNGAPTMGKAGPPDRPPSNSRMSISPRA